jgi:hypothetical protein
VPPFFPVTRSWIQSFPTRADYVNPGQSSLNCGFSCKTAAGNEEDAAERHRKHCSRDASQFMVAPKKGQSVTGLAFGCYRVVAGGGAVTGAGTGAAGRVVLALPVVVPGELFALGCEPPLHGPHVNSAPTINSAAMIAPTVPPPIPVLRSSSGGRLFRSFCINFSSYEQKNFSNNQIVPKKHRPHLPFTSRPTRVRGFF